MISLQGITDLKPFPSRSLIFLPGGAVAPLPLRQKCLWVGDYLLWTVIVIQTQTSGRHPSDPGDCSISSVSPIGEVE